jgi:hypothetical protein
MQVIFDNDETWSLMSLMVSQIIDKADLSSDGKAAVRRWRTDHAEGTVDLADLTVEFNEAIGSTLDEKTTKLIRRRGHYVSTREEA